MYREFEDPAAAKPELAPGRPFCWSEEQGGILLLLAVGYGCGRMGGMPRTARASVGEGICYHVINRGNARAEVFHKEHDYEAFIGLIAATCRRLIAVPQASLPAL